MNKVSKLSLRRRARKVKKFYPSRPKKLFTHTLSVYRLYSMRSETTQYINLGDLFNNTKPYNTFINGFQQYKIRQIVISADSCQQYNQTTPGFWYKFNTNGACDPLNQNCKYYKMTKGGKPIRYRNRGNNEEFGIWRDMSKDSELSLRMYYFTKMEEDDVTKPFQFQAKISFNLQLRYPVNNYVEEFMNREIDVEKEFQEKKRVQHHYDLNLSVSSVNSLSLNNSAIEKDINTSNRLEEKKKRKRKQNRRKLGVSQSSFSIEQKKKEIPLCEERASMEVLGPAAKGITKDGFEILNNTNYLKASPSEKYSELIIRGIDPNVREDFEKNIHDFIRLYRETHDGRGPSENTLDWERYEFLKRADEYVRNKHRINMIEEQGRRNETLDEINRGIRKLKNDYRQWNVEQRKKDTENIKKHVIKDLQKYEDMRETNREKNKIIGPANAMERRWKKKK